ncbi:MAG: amidase [Candidatus Binataceae bacterium]|nr:amidase [Candidatus Binataceae bacterium]
MSVKAPSIEDLTRISDSFGMRLSREQIQQFKQIIDPTLASYDRLDQLTEPTLEVKYPDRKNWKPTEKENPLGGWYWRCEIKGAPDGLLKGKTLAMKDNVCVANVPLMCGSRLLEGFVPKVDATIVTRILDAGGTILGKANCESLCCSGNSHTSDSGIVHNPHDLSRSPGGSSTGSGALVAAGSVDMAIGADQAGSIRIPCSWSGIYGLKPTYGLVPYTGIGPMELTIDHTGPMARSAREVALLLEAIAGPDGLDPRQRAGLMPQKYSQALTGDIKGLRFGVVKEGFGLNQPTRSQKDVDDAVREAAHALAKYGAQVKEISLPMHSDGFHIWAGIAGEGILSFMLEGGGAGRHWKGFYPTEMIETFARAMAEHADYLSDSAKLFALTGRYMREQYHGRYYAKAQNLARTLLAAYNEALKDCDVLVMPTTPVKAGKIPPKGCSLAESVQCALEPVPNTCPFNAVGLPALNVPCAVSEGLPVGMMFVGRMGEDATLLRAADVFQHKIFDTPIPQHKAA